MIKANIMAVDQEQLSRAVYAYHSQESRDPSYIVMSSETKNALNAAAVPKLLILDEMDERSTYTTYMGNPIAVCEKLAFGEVEII